MCVLREQYNELHFYMHGDFDREHCSKPQIAVE